MMGTRTSRRFLVVRLTPEMEKMIVFLCSDVKFGMQKRYQDWFQRQVSSSVQGCCHNLLNIICGDTCCSPDIIGSPILISAYNYFSKWPNKEKKGEFERQISDVISRRISINFKILTYFL